MDILRLAADRKRLLLWFVSATILTVLVVSYRRIPSFSSKLPAAMSASETLHSYRHVCLEHIHRSSSIKRIVVYNSARNRISPIRVSDGHDVFKQTYFWTLYFRKGQIPSSHVITYEPAYFTKAKCGTNFHHFWSNYFKGLYGFIKLNGDLNARQVNVVADVYKTSECSTAPLFTTIIQIMPVHMLNILDTTHGTCFHKAHFGTFQRNIEPFEIENRVYSLLNISKENCTDKPLLILQDRNYRRILNIRDLRQTAVKTGFQAEIVAFENITAKEQLRWMRCADVLVGVHGAGLEWFHFMKKPAALIEIGWNHWSSGLYTARATAQGYRAFALNSTAIVGEKAWRTHVDATSRNRQLQHENTVSPAAVFKRERMFDHYRNTNIWKFADCKVNLTQFQELLLRI